MKKKYLFFTVCLISILIFGCAKSNNIPTAASGSSLNVVNEYSLRGHGRNLFITDSLMIVSEDQAGFSIFNHTNGETVYQMDNLEDDYEKNFRDIYLNEEKEDLFIVNKYAEEAGIKCYNVEDYGNISEQAPIIGDTYGISKFTGSSSSEGTLVTWTYGDNLIKTGFYSDFWDGNQAEIHEMPFVVESFDQDENYLYVCSEQLGIYILEKEDFTVVANIDTIDEAIDVKIVDNSLFVANKNYGLSIYDVSDLNEIIELSSVETSGWARAIDVENDIVVVGSGGGGVYVFDVSDRTNPELLGNIGDEIIGYTYDVNIFNETIFAATKIGAFQISID